MSDKLNDMVPDAVNEEVAESVEVDDTVKVTDTLAEVAQNTEEQSAESAAEEITEDTAEQAQTDAEPAAAPDKPKKKKKALLISLISAGAAIIVAAAVLLLWLFVFKDRNNPFVLVSQMYENSQPSKITATSSQVFGVVKNDAGEVTFPGHELKGEYILVIGAVDGKPAAKYTSSQDRLGSVKEGSGESIREPITTDTEVREFIEGTGLRITTNGKVGEWDPEGNSIIPARGAISLNLSTKLTDTYTYENNKLSFTVAKDKTEELFGAGNGLPSDVNVEITTDGAFVIGVKLSYVVAADPEADTSESIITIEAVYTYDFEVINID